MSVYGITIAFAWLFLIPAEAVYDGKYAVGVMQTRSKNTSQSIKDYCEAMFFSYDDDLMVYPEGTLNDVNSATLVPDPAENVTPYKNKTYDNYEVIRAISESVSENYVYVVINLFERVNCTNSMKDCPPRGYFVYNTNVAFNRTGAVIARYRKYNLNGEEGVDTPRTAEMVTFTTDFNITFGMFTGWDILFRPAADLVRERKVKNIIFPNAWRGELPFLTGVQLQSGWSYSLNVNLLAAGVNKPSAGYSGTGIYKKRERSWTCMNDRDLDLVLLGKVPLNDSKTHLVRSGGVRGLNLAEDPTIKSSAGVNLDPRVGKFREEVCQGALCCSYTAKYNQSQSPNSDSYTYRALAFHGHRKFGENITMEVAYCAVVLCTGGNCAKKPENGNFPVHFDEIRVEGQFPGKDTLQIPTSLTWDNFDKEQFANTKLYYFSFDSRRINSTTSRAFIENTIPVRDAITFGIYSFTYN